MQIMRTLMALTAALLLTGPAAAQQANETATNPAVLASNAFACDLFKKLDEGNRAKNVFFSPFSISSALAMTLQGARGDTALEMGEVLRLPPSLRAKNDAEPWLTEPYATGFSEFKRRLAANPDPAKAEAIRKQVVELRKQLDDVNGQIRAAQKQKTPFKKTLAMTEEAKKLAASINTLASQVDQFDLRIANALWGDKTYPFRKEFLTTVDRSFGTGLLRLADFRNNYPGERAIINRWVEEQTNDHIKDLLPVLKPEEARLLRLVLINAIYFKGEWSQPFDAKKTKTEDFLLADGGKAAAAMMHDVKEARYAAFNGDGSFFTTPANMPFGGGDTVAKYPGQDGFLMAELPIKGDKLGVVFLAPQKVDGLAAIEAKLSGENLTAWLSKLEKRKVNVALPRFKLDTDYALGDILKSMGMRKAFDQLAADFTAMSDSTNPADRLSISRVIHKAFVEVNEKGAEAAAATAVMMGGDRLRAEPFTPAFRADRPFLFLIRDMDSGMVLFMGRLTRP
jgi:serine protease inhibitor